MRLLVLGHDTSDLPEMPEEITQVWTTFPMPDELWDWLQDSDVDITLVCSDPSILSDDVLEAVSEIIEAAEPHKAIIDTSRPGDVAVMAWTDSDDDHRALKELTRHGVVTHDMTDGFQQLVLEHPVDDVVKLLTERITEDVLKTVRAEIADKFAELAKHRRFRSGSIKE